MKPYLRSQKYIIILFYVFSLVFSTEFIITTSQVIISSKIYQMKQLICCMTCDDGRWQYRKYTTIKYFMSCNPQVRIGKAPVRLHTFSFYMCILDKYSKSSDFWNPIHAISHLGDWLIELMIMIDKAYDINKLLYIRKMDIDIEKKNHNIVLHHNYMLFMQYSWSKYFKQEYNTIVSMWWENLNFGKIILFCKEQIVSEAIPFNIRTCLAPGALPFEVCEYNSAPSHT